MRYLKTVSPAILIVLLVAVSLFFFFRDREMEPLSPALEDIMERGELVVLTRNAPTTYYFDRNEQPAGFEYDLVSRFAEWLGVPARFVVEHSVGEIMDALDRGEAHLAAANLTKTEPRAQRFTFGPPYMEIEQQVVCRRGGNCPDSIEDLDSVSLMIISESSYEERLREIRDTMLPELSWQAMPGLSTEMILQKVWEGEVDCTVADSNIVQKNRRFFPELVVAFPITEPQELVWLLPKGADDLVHSVETWFDEFVNSNTFSAIHTRHYAHVEIFDYVDITRFMRSVDERLPRYRSYFEEAAEAYGFDWTLLAAMAYQESHWNPDARSHTGVRGIMMLTLDTAADLEIEDRVDVEASIDGGARYLAQLRERLPEAVLEPDRTWIALAAYNIGMGHIYDARALAERYGYDKNTWAGLREVLPKLAQPDYYRYLRFGYARGGEPVLYVARVRNYQQVLERVLEWEDSKGWL